MGRNHEDAERIVEGIRELQLQWSAHESSMKASLQEAQQVVISRRPPRLLVRNPG